jgi:hypothetical protein
MSEWDRLFPDKEEDVAAVAALNSSRAFDVPFDLAYIGYAGADGAATVAGALANSVEAALKFAHVEGAMPDTDWFDNLRFMTPEDAFGEEWRSGHEGYDWIKGAQALVGAILAGALISKVPSVAAQGLHIVTSGIGQYRAYKARTELRHAVDEIGEEQDQILGLLGTGSGMHVLYSVLSKLVDALDSNSFQDKTLLKNLLSTLLDSGKELAQ